MTKVMESNRAYNELEVVNVRLVKEPSIISEKPIGSPNDAVELISQFMSEFDREVVCVLNIATDGKPISMNVASIGTLNSALVSPRDILKSTILANASAFIMLHCHPSGNPRPSREDAITTQRLKEAGDVLEIKMVDHIIVGCGNESRFSFMEKGLLQSNDVVASYDDYFDDRER